jgi:hypothetical protein
MAKQKPKTKVASTTKPKYPQSELKKVGQPYNYDSIGFKNSQIDVLKSKMDKFATDFSRENADIATNLPASFISGTKPEKRGRDVWQGGDKQWYEPNKRNQLIEDVYEAKGPLTGKKGMSISKYLQNRKTLRSYYVDENLDTNKKSGK